MKMFKKIMAVALTAVMAVSMLTGCAIGDAVHEKQLLNALNDAGTTTKVNGAFHKYVKDNKVTVNGVDYTLSEKATAVAKEFAALKTEKVDALKAGAVIDLTDKEVAEGKYVIAAVVVPTSGDYKWNKLAGDVNGILGKGYTATADTKDVKEVSVAMETRTTKKADTNGKEYDIIVVVAAKVAAKV